MQKVFITEYLKRQKFDMAKNYFQNDQVMLIQPGDTSYNRNSSDNEHSSLLEAQMEKFLEDYQNNIIYGNFFNLKI